MGYLNEQVSSAMEVYYQEIEGDLIRLAKQGTFDVITHGCNCFCQMGAGIAPQMASAFGCDEFKMEIKSYIDYTEDGLDFKVITKNRGDINKLGTIDYQHQYLWFEHPAVTEPGVAYPMNSKSPGQPGVKDIIVVNSYTQYNYGANHKDGVAKPIDYEALTLCLRKINKTFAGKHIGLPKIGAGLAGGDWNRIKNIIQTELKDMKVSVVIYKP
jgi:O-acetyl-ADP-ribose deacetylase (regulator of RNase III)